MNQWGRNIRLSIAGESHGAALAVTIDGLPPGFEIDFAKVSAEMARRAPGQNAMSTPRKEADEYEILSGVFNGKTTGAPLCAIIRNTNTRSGDYRPEIMRPGHADYTAHVKYGGFNDYRGGGHFSGRITALIVFAGAIAKQILQSRYQIEIAARMLEINHICDAEKFESEILAAKSRGDSVGGVIECVANNVLIGLGEPFFGSVESAVSAMMFSIPAVKGIEFGDGFGLTKMYGSEANDGMYFENGEVKFSSNHNGGINGGISNGQPIVFRVAIKPTPSVSVEQTTVDVAAGETVTTNITGRHDPCIVPRAVPVVEASCALCILDLISEGRNLA